MIAGTTPTLTLRLSDNTVDLGQAAAVYFTLTQGPVEVTKDNGWMDIDGNVVQVWLSQKDTLRLQPGYAEIQLNWTYTQEIDHDRKRNATKPKKIEITRQLLKRVIR